MIREFVGTLLLQALYIKDVNRVIGDRALTFTKLSTPLIRIEASLNSRPIIALHDDPEEVVALSPGDFFIG